MKKPTKLSLVPSEKTSEQLRAEKYTNLKDKYNTKNPDIDVKYFELPITGDISVQVTDRETGLPLFNAMVEPIGDKASPSSYKLVEVRKPFFKDSENFIATPDIIKRAMQKVEEDYLVPIVKGVRRLGSSANKVFEQVDFLKDLDLPESNIENIGKKAVKKLPILETAIIPLAAKGLAAGLTGGISLGVEAASELSDSEESGASKSMPDYWLEKGIKDPEEQLRRARLSSFKKDLPTYDKIPSRYEKPSIREHKENMLRAEMDGTARDNYVEDMQEEDDYKKFQKLLERIKL